MSAKNVELVRRLLPEESDLVEVLASDDPVAALTGDPDLSLPDLEVEFAGTQSGAPGLHYRGLEGLVEGWRDWLVPWASYRLRIDEYIDAGDKVVLLVSVRARTSRDGVAFEHQAAAVWTLRDGSPVAVHFFLEQEEALRFAGVEAE
jgi:ketosteroid isomerase-like protein